MSTDNSAEYDERALALAKEDALNDIEAGVNRCDEDTVADTEALLFHVTGRKLHEFDEDEVEDLVIRLVEVYDEAYIDTYVSEQVAYGESDE